MRDKEYLKKIDEAIAYWYMIQNKQQDKVYKSDYYL